MDNEQLDALIRENADAVHHASPGHWQFDFFGRVLIALTDESMNRMRVITPVAEAAELEPEVLNECMMANFDRALDARYALNGDYLWSAFIHPLRQLEPGQVVDALMQVATLAVTFGMTFSSSGLSFGSRGAEEPGGASEGPAAD